MTIRGLPLRAYKPLPIKFPHVTLIHKENLYWSLLTLFIQASRLSTRMALYLTLITRADLVSVTIRRATLMVRRILMETFSIG